MPRIVSTVAILICFVIPVDSIASSYYQDVTIHESDNSGISFTINFENIEKHITYINHDSSVILSKNIVIGLPINTEPIISNVVAENLRQLPKLDDIEFITPTDDLVRIGKVEKIRGKKTVTLGVYPYSDGLYYSQIKIDLKFASNNKTEQDFIISPPDPIFDRMMEYTVLNYDQSR